MFYRTLDFLYGFYPIQNNFPYRKPQILRPPGVLGSWRESRIIFREQGEIAITGILREPRSKLLILGI